MIGRLTGRYEAVDATLALIDVQGVGYLVHAPALSLARWDRDARGADGMVTVWTEMAVREDAITLYGFATLLERGWFRLLTAVQGVGARVALNLLSVLEPEALQAAIAAGDRTTLARADNVGPKLAARLVAELKDKAPLGAVALRPSASMATGGAAGPGGGGVAADVASALGHLGYDPARAHAIATRLAAADPDAGFDQLMRLALGEITR